MDCPLQSVTLCPPQYSKWPDLSLHVSLVAFVCALLGAAFHFHIRKATWATVAGQLLLVGGTEVFRLVEVMAAE